MWLNDSMFPFVRGHCELMGNNPHCFSIQTKGTELHTVFSCSLQNSQEHADGPQ